MTISSTSGSYEDAKNSTFETQDEDNSSSRTLARDDTASTSRGTPASDSTTSKAEISISETQGVRSGKCKWFNVAKGWGFIRANDGGQDVFVHQSVIQMSGFRSLGEMEDVEFECKLTERGLEATRVSAPGGVECRGSAFRPRPKKRFRRIRCYNCGAFANHIAAKCSLGPQPKRCHSCKSEEHLVADCPNKKAETQTETSESEDLDQQKQEPS